MKEVLALMKECGVEEGTPLYFTTTDLVMQPSYRELFMLIETQEGRLDWLERKHAQMNVMAVCDFDMQFTFVVAGWPGTAHDTRILNDSLVKYAHRFPKPPEGKYYLIDSGYPNRKGYLAPYKGQIYHMSEFRNGRKPVGKYEFYNHTHSRGRNAVEHRFGVLKAKFRILKAVPSFKPRRQKKIILACMSLHNYIRETKLPDEEFDKYDEDDDYMPEGEEPLQGDDVSVRIDDVHMNSVRDTIADSLWSSMEE